MGSWKPQAIRKEDSQTNPQPVTLRVHLILLGIK